MGLRFVASGTAGANNVKMTDGGVPGASFAKINSDTGKTETSVT
ncbi:hypothetical protein [Bdellovibrio sp. NC01]|nr:hypothetical protein [Bdellovibrio sp. NC01]